MRERGHAAVETALLAPWIFVLFAAVFDLGFYSYALIATENAARSAAVYAARSSSATNASSIATTRARACMIALRELRGMPNVPSTLSACQTLNSITDGQPVALDLTAVNGPDNWPSVRVTAQYRTPQLFPLPGLMGRMTVSRIVEVRVRGS